MLERRRITRVFPGACSGNAQRRLMVAPQGVAIGLSFDERDMLARSCLIEPIEAVWDRLGSRFPTKAIISALAFFHPEPVAHGHLSAVFVVVGYANASVPPIIREPE